MNLYTITFASETHTLIAEVRATTPLEALERAIKNTFNRTKCTLVNLGETEVNMFTQKPNTALIKANKAEPVGYYLIKGFEVA